MGEGPKENFSFFLCDRKLRMTIDSLHLYVIEVSLTWNWLLYRDGIAAGLWPHILTAVEIITIEKVVVIESLMSSE